MIDYSENTKLWVNWLSEYWESFIDFLESAHLENIKDVTRIIKACKRLEEKFQGKKRKTWEDYHSHPYEVARIFIDIHRNRVSENWLIACILHDNIEDIESENFSEIEKDFWTEVAILVELLSKPDLELFMNDKEQRNKYYFCNFESLASLRKYIKKSCEDRWIIHQEKNKWPKRTNFNTWVISKSTVRRYAFLIWVIKICDRVHNLCTMPWNAYDIHKIEKKMHETENYFTDLAHELHGSHPLLIDKLRKSLINAKQNINRLKVLGTIQ